jgi:hypothetical protein
MVQEAGLASGPVWTGAQNLTPNGIRSPDRPARRQSLYRLSYPAATGPAVSVAYAYKELNTWVYSTMEIKFLASAFFSKIRPKNARNKTHGIYSGQLLIQTCNQCSIYFILCSTLQLLSHLQVGFEFHDCVQRCNWDISHFYTTYNVSEGDL